MWCNLTLTDISYEFYISQMYSSACLLRGPHPHNQKSQQVKQRMYISGWHLVGIHGVVPMSQRPSYKLETPQFALYFDILDSCGQ